MACGQDHCLAVCASGHVFSWGAAEDGQLGMLPNPLRPSCGEAHSAVLTKDGKVFTFGEGRHGQLGHNSSANEVKPTLVDGLDGPASQIACGRRHTLVLGSSGQLWAFGNGVKGQIETGQTEDSLTPTLVQLPWTADSAAAIPNLRISAGWNTNFAYSSPVQVTCEII
uniref:Secretion regulating guanine nucleotide exchange factor n=1 Tax=Lates calcarifer TaxID=8187 RepID=A0A4W6BSM9_LATCA